MHIAGEIQLTEWIQQGIYLIGSLSFWAARLKRKPLHYRENFLMTLLVQITIFSQRHILQKII